MKDNYDYTNQDDYETPKSVKSNKPKEVFRKLFAKVFSGKYDSRDNNYHSQAPMASKPSKSKISLLKTKENVKAGFKELFKEIFPKFDMVEYDMREILDNSYDSAPSYEYKQPSNTNQLTVLKHKQRHVHSTTAKPSFKVETTTTEDYFLKNHFLFKH